MIIEANWTLIIELITVLQLIILHSIMQLLCNMLSICVVISHAANNPISCISVCLWHILVNLSTELCSQDGEYACHLTKKASWICRVHKSPTETDYRCEICVLLWSTYVSFGNKVGRHIQSMRQYTKYIPIYLLLK